MSSNFRMAHIAACLQELLPFVNDDFLFMGIWQKRGHPCPMDTLLVLLMYFSLTQTDQLLVHLQSSSTNAVHYNVPESVKNGVPLFYLPQPASLEPFLNIILLIFKSHPDRSAVSSSSVIFHQCCSLQCT